MARNLTEGNPFFDITNTCLSLTTTKIIMIHTADKSRYLTTYFYGRILVLITRGSSAAQSSN